MFRNNSFSVIGAIFISFLLSACFHNDDGGVAPTNTGTTPTTLAVVKALYPDNGTDWNDYVVNDGADQFDAMDMGCDAADGPGYSACIHGGEMRSVEVSGHSSCTGLTATDALGAFDWTCRVISGQAYMISTGLKDTVSVEGTADGTANGQLLDSAASFVTYGIKVGSTVMNVTDYTTTTVVSVDSENQLTLADDIFVSTEEYLIIVDKNLSDLIDFAAPGWKSNAVTVLDNATPLFTTTSSKWWNNPVVIDNDGGNLSTAGTIYLVTIDPAAIYSIDASKIALVVKPGVTLSGVNGAENSIYAFLQNFLWLEGGVNAADGQYACFWIEAVKFSVVRGVRANNADYNLWLEDVSNNLLNNVISNNIHIAGVTAGVYMIQAEYNTFKNVIAASHPDGIIIETSSNNTLTNVATINNSRYGIWINSLSDNNSLSNIFTAGNDYGLYLNSSSNNNLSNITASDNESEGIMLDNSSDNNSLSDIVASNNNDGDGVYLLNSSNNSLSNISALNNYWTGVYISNSSNNNSLSNITVGNNRTSGIQVSSSSGNVLSDITADDNNLGVFLELSSNNNLSNITADNNGDTGIQLNNSSNNVLSDIESINNPDTGISISNSTDNILTDITSSNNGFAGFYILLSSNNQLSDITVANNTTYGVYLGTSSNNSVSNLDAYLNSEGVSLDGSSNNSLSDIIAANNEGGVSLYNSADFNSLSKIITTNNDLGVYLQGASNNSLLNMTASNNADSGVVLETSSNNNNLSNITAANNGFYGVYLQGSSNNNSLSNIAAVNNTHVGVYLNSASNSSVSNIAASDTGYGVVLQNATSNSYFTGLLKVGNNSSGDCSDLQVGDTFSDVNCTAVAPSDFALTQSVAITSSFVGKVITDDAINSSDAGGSASFPASPITFDWTSFENRYRGWGNNGAFPGADSRGLWWTGMGSIWDWSADINDTVIKNVLNVPDGDDTITHTWSDASSTTYLRNAIEIVDDVIGNNNGLCETNETCLYTPNIGSYQGHDALQSAGTFINGTITGVTLVEYSINGY